MRPEHLFAAGIILLIFGLIGMGFAEVFERNMSIRAYGRVARAGEVTLYIGATLLGLAVAFGMAGAVLS